MLEYEWGNPSTIMFTGDEPTQDSDQTRQILANFHQESFTGAHHHFSHSTTTASAATADTFSHHLFHNNHSDIHQSFYDPRSNYTSTTSYPPPPPPPAMLTLDPLSGATGGGGGVGGGFMLVPKSEEIGRPEDFTARIGLNLGHRTYFSADDDFVNRLYRRSRTGPLEPGSSTNSPRCQAEGCTADLTNSKHYHRRHKVCEFHSKASTVIAGGLTQRFCQQCSRFHLLSEFDNGKRSCRKRLADHNRRRRKSHQQPNQDRHKSQAENTTTNPSSENLARSPADSGAHSSSSVTVAVSPPPPSSDCFRQSSYLATTASSGSSRSLFYFNE